MKRFRWQIIIVVLALAAIVFLLLGQQTTVLPGVESIIQPESGGVYTEALIGSLGRLNPLLDAGNPADQAVNQLIFSSLITFDSHGIPQGDLAESWGVSQDGTVYNFSIKPQAVWHDGTTVTSEDVLFTIELIKDENIPIPEDMRDFWSQIQARPIDDKTLQFQLPESFAPFLDYLTFGVLPKHILGNLTADQLINHPFNLEPVGSGKFKFETLQVENGAIVGLVLSSFDDYYGDKPYIDEVIFRYFPTHQAAMAAYQNGEVMGVSEIPPEILDTALKEEELNLYTGRRSRLNMVFLNQDLPELPFFEDPDVRHALMIGLNRRWIVDRILTGQAIIADGPIFPENWAYYDGQQKFKYDVDAAISLLKGAGYTIPTEGGGVRAKDGVRLAFELIYPNDMTYQQIAESIQRDWSKIGVGITLKPLSYEEMISEYLDKRTYQAALVELNLDGFADPDPYPFWHQAQATGGQNYSGWDDRQASEYIEQARVLVDFEDRRKRYQNFQVRFFTELPALPLYYPVYSYAVDAQVKGVSMGPVSRASDRFNTISFWYLQAISAVEVSATPTEPVDEGG